MDIQDLVPKHKHDIETAEKLKQYSYYQIKPIVPDLFKWLQDINWPVSRPVADYLTGITPYITNEIIHVLKTNDAEWKYFVLLVFNHTISNERILLELERIMNNDSFNESPDVQELARVMLERRAYKGLRVRNPFFRFIQNNDQARADMVAQWYYQEWDIPNEKTKAKLASFTPDEFHVIMYIDDVPVATGGIHHQVGLTVHEPRFAVHRHWLALVYTEPDVRGNGYGTQLCTFLEKEAKSRGIKELHLFTDTAESLYKRLGWEVVERLALGPRNVVVMKKIL